MNIIIASDSFKDALPAHKVCEAIAKGIESTCPGFNLVKMPLADGGEGTSKILTHHANGKLIEVETVDALGRKIIAAYGLSQDNKTAFIDMASASGLQLIGYNERNPMKTTSYGTGLLIADAINKNVDEIILGIGGSATNDGGMGMARALGFKFYDQEGTERLGNGADLIHIDHIEKSNLVFPKITVLCDVKNPLYGLSGAAYVYGRQKGGDEKQIEALDKGLKHFSNKVKKILKVDYSKIHGSGAAGGMGFGAMAFLDAQLVSGINFILDFVEFDQALDHCDLVITGEGRLDNQSLQGKLIQGICRRARMYKKPVVALCGSMLASTNAIKEIGLAGAFSIQQTPCSLERAIENTSEQLSLTAFQIANLINYLE